MRAGLGKRAHEGGGDRPRGVAGLPRRTCYGGLSTALPRCRPHRPACCRPPKRSPARPPRSAFLGLVQRADHRDRRRARARGSCARVPKAIRRLLPAGRSPRPARPPAVRLRADGYFSALRGELHSDFQSAKRHRAGRADAAGCGAVGEDPYAMASLGARRLLRPRRPLRSTGCFYAYTEGRLQEHFAWGSTIGRSSRTQSRSNRRFRGGARLTIRSFAKIFTRGD